MDSKDQKHNSQNRLLLTSAVLTFFYYAEAKFQGLSVAGSSIVFQNEGAVIEFTWAIWFYYYWRCYQYYKELGAKEYNDAINATYIERLGPYIKRMGQDDFKLLPNTDAFKSSRVKFAIGNSRRLLLHRDSASNYPNEYDSSRFRARLLLLFRLHRIAAHHRMQGGPVRINLLSDFAMNGSVFRKMKQLLLMTLFGVGLRAIIYPPTDRFDQHGHLRYAVELPFSVAFKLVAIHARTIVMRPQFMENQAPLVLGLIPVCYSIFVNRSGLASTLTFIKSLFA